MRRVGPRGAALLFLAVLLGAKSPAPSREPRDFEFKRLNRPYRDVAKGAAPVDKGPLRVELSSPRQEVVLVEHQLRLTPRGDGTHDAELWARFQGRGRVEAWVSVGGLGLGQRFQDDLTLPDQTRTLHGRVKIVRGQGGYLVTTLALPPEVAVQIRSRLAGDVVGWCDRLASVPFSPVECGGLDRALASATVPLPAPGQTYGLADEDLTADDRRSLDAYLGIRAKK